jgi:hypothetical protein
VLGSRRAAGAGRSNEVLEEKYLDYSQRAIEDCYHEAAHAIFWHRAEVEITELRVGGEGKIETQWSIDPPPERALEMATGCLAGPLSAGILRGHGFQPMTFAQFINV